jgi:ligand-binding sensor domain-containing protein/signal transduction histidine kinase
MTRWWIKARVGAALGLVALHGANLEAAAAESDARSADALSLSTPRLSLAESVAPVLPGRFQITTWTTSQGLPGNWIECLLQTRDGYLWLGSPEGLVRFDGLKFVRFNSENCPAFKSDVVKALAEDTEGALWLATKNGALRFGSRGVQRFSTAEGLPSDTINGLCPRAAGGMWIATDGGLTPFTETGMRHFADARLRIPGVFAVNGDSAGQVWVATEGCLQTLNVENGHFSLVWGFADKESHRRPSVDRIYRARDGELWFSVRSKLLRLRQGQIEEFSVPLAAGDDRARTFLEDSAGRLWIIKGHAVHLWVNDRFVQMDRALGGEDSLVNCMIEDAQGNFWIGSRHGGLSRLKPVPFQAFTKKHGSPHNSLQAVSPRRAGGLWLATRGGIASFNNGVFDLVITPGGQADFPVTTIFEDAFGGLWCGVPQGGLTIITRDAQTFALPTDLLSSAANRIVVQDTRTNVWAGGPQGISRLLPIPGVVWNPNVRAGVQVTHSECWNYKADEIVCWAPSRLWRFDRQRWWHAGDDFVQGALPEDLIKAGRDFFTAMIPRREPTNYDIRTALRDREDTLWFGTHGGGLQRFRDNEFVPFTTRDGLAHDNVCCLYEARDGALWIGTDQGLTRLKQGRLTSITTAHGLPPGAINGILEDDLGAFWIAYGEGLCRVSATELNAVADGRGLRVESVVFDEADGLLSGSTDGNTQPAACKTPDGLLWFATSQGLVQVVPTAVRARTNAPAVFVEELRTPDRAVDLTARPVVQLPVASSQLAGVSGQLSKGGSQKPVVSSPSSVVNGSANDASGRTEQSRTAVSDLGPPASDLQAAPRSTTPPLPHSLAQSSTPLSTNNQLRTTNHGLRTTNHGLRPAKSEIRNPKSEIVLPAGSGRYLEIRYTALDFSAPEAIRFKYRLPRVDDDWIDVGSRRVAYYTNLRPGRYHFRVQATGKQGLRAENDAILAFTIQPFFWQAWWFRAGTASAAILAVGTLVRQRLQRLRYLHELEQAAALAKQRASLARDLHDDIGNSVTHIALLSETARQQLNPANPADKQLLRLTQTARQIIANVSEMVWATNPTNDTLPNLAAYLREHAARHFEGTAIRCELDFPSEVPSLPVSGEFRRRVVLLVKEALGNVLKHSGAQTVVVRLEVDPPRLRLTIADDGRGFDVTQSPAAATSPASGGNGLRNMRERARQLGGEIHIESAPGEGGRIRVQVRLAAN